MLVEITGTIQVDTSKRSKYSLDNELLANISSVVNKLEGISKATFTVEGKTLSHLDFQHQDKPKIVNTEHSKLESLEKNKFDHFWNDTQSCTPPPKQKDFTKKDFEKLLGELNMISNLTMLMSNPYGTVSGRLSKAFLPKVDTSSLPVEITEDLERVLEGRGITSSSYKVGDSVKFRQLMREVLGVILISGDRQWAYILDGISGPVPESLLLTENWLRDPSEEPLEEHKNITVHKALDPARFITGELVYCDNASRYIKNSMREDSGEMIYLFDTLGWVEDTRLSKVQVAPYEEGLKKPRKRKMPVRSSVQRVSKEVPKYSVGDYALVVNTWAFIVAQVNIEDTFRYKLRGFDYLVFEEDITRTVKEIRDI